MSISNRKLFVIVMLVLLASSSISARLLRMQSDFQLTSRMSTAEADVGGREGPEEEIETTYDLGVDLSEDAKPSMSRAQRNRLRFKRRRFRRSG